MRLFLDGKIKFLQIAELVEKAAYSVNNIKDFGLEDVLECDKFSRAAVNSYI